MRRAAIRQAFGLKCVGLLPDNVQIIWENTPVQNADSFTAWLHLGLVFTADGDEEHLLGTAQELTTGQLQGWLAVLIGSGMEQLDNLVDQLDGALGQQRFDRLVTKRLEAERPLDSPPYHKLHFAIPFTYYQPSSDGQKAQ